PYTTPFRSAGPGGASAGRFAGDLSGQRLPPRKGAIAFSKICAIWSEATAQRATTIPAVMRVISTQPGTSPCSEARRARRRLRSPARCRMRSDVPGWARRWRGRMRVWSRVRWTVMSASSADGSGSGPGRVRIGAVGDGGTEDRAMTDEVGDRDDVAVAGDGGGGRGSSEQVRAGE